MEITKEFIEANLGKTFLIKYKKPTHIGIGKKLVLSTEVKVRFFISSKHNLCYLSGKQTSAGLEISYLNLIMAESITEFVKKEKPSNDPIARAKRIRRKIHPNAWRDIRDKLTNIISGTEEKFPADWSGEEKYRQLALIIPRHEKDVVLTELKLAFENKSPYRWSRKAQSLNGRDYSIECSVDADGNFRAWFSSEFRNCLNGDYYLLLNPTTAIFYERD